MKNIPVVPMSYLERFSRNSAIISAWRNYEPEVLAYLDRDLGSSVQQMTQQLAVYDQASSRLELLFPPSQKRWSKGTQQAVELTVTLIGAFTFSTIPQILGGASNRGTLATLAGLVGGAAVAWFTHDRANKALGDWRCAHSSQNALKTIHKLDSLSPYKNFLTSSYWGRREELLWELEADTLTPPFPLDFAGAVVATVLEIAAAFWLTFPAGPVVAALAGAFPAAVIWLSSVFQSERVDFAEWALVKVRLYEKYLPLQAETEAGEPYTLVSDQELLKVAKNNGRFNYFVAVNTEGVQTPQGAEAQVLVNLAESEMQDWVQAYRSAKQALVSNYQEALQQAERIEVSPPLLEVAGRRPEEVKRSQALALETERHRLINSLMSEQETELQELRNAYSTVIEWWQVTLVQSRRRLDFCESIEPTPN